MTESGEERRVGRLSGAEAGGRAAAALRRTAAIHWPLLIALAYALAIGFWQLPDRGAVFVDEGQQFLEARWIDSKISYLTGHFPSGFDEKRFVLDDGSGRPLVYAKPLHALLGAMAARLLPGDGPTSVLLLQGLLGLGTIVLVYAIGWRLGGPLVAAMSGGALAFSATFLAYRRSMLPEMDSVFFFALAVLALVAWSGRARLTGPRALGVGALTGLCFTANDRWYVALPLVLLMVVAVEARKGAWHREVLRASRLVLAVSAGFAIPVLLFEAVSTSFLWIAHDGGVELPYQTYFQQLYGRYRLVVDVHRGSPDLSNIPQSPYPGYIAAFDGVVWLAVAVAAALFLVVRWRRAHAVPLLWTFGPLLLASASTLTAPRYMSFAIPGIALGIGLAGGVGWEARSAWFRTLALAAVSAAFVSSTVNSPQIFRIRAGWGEALAVAREGGGTIISPKSFPVAAHAGLNRVVLGFEDSLQWARERETQGARWLLLELWTTPGTPLRAVAGRKGSHTVLGPPGELSIYALQRGRPVVFRRFAPHGFVYEGFPPDLDRLIVLYDLRSLRL